MDKRELSLSFVVVAIVVLAVVILLFVGVWDEPSVGGDRDVHGCLGAAGYTWDEGVGGCVREGSWMIVKGLRLGLLLILLGGRS